MIARHLFESDHPGESIVDDSNDLRLVREALRPMPSGKLRLALSVAIPIVAVGGPAATYFPAVGERLGTRTVVPPHAAVCNALGAVVSGVVQRVEARITSPSPGLYRVHLPDGTDDFPTLEAAAQCATERAAEIATERAIRAGAGDVHVTTTRSDRVGSGPSGLSIFVESSVQARAAGRPLVRR